MRSVEFAVKTLRLILLVAVPLSACVTTPPVRYRVVLYVPPRPPGCPVQSFGRERPWGARDIAWLRLDCTSQGGGRCAAEFNEAVCRAGGNAVFGAQDEYVQVSRYQRMHYLTGTIGLVPD